MIVTIDCRDTINCKVTIVLCNRAQDQSRWIQEAIWIQRTPNDMNFFFFFLKGGGGEAYKLSDIYDALAKSLKTVTGRFSILDVS